jgi:hypothetical protein
VSAKRGGELADAALTRCWECGREVSEFEAIAQRWTYWSGGGGLLPYCPQCMQRSLGLPLMHEPGEGTGG